MGCGACQGADAPRRCIGDRFSDTRFSHTRLSDTRFSAERVSDVIGLVAQ
jgi:hypothetical protein